MGTGSHECKKCGFPWGTRRLYIKYHRSWKGVGWWCRNCGEVTLDEKWRITTSKTEGQTSKDVQLSPQAKELLSHIMRKGSLTRQHVITNLGQRRELYVLKERELVAQFGNVILPTIKAWKMFE